MWFAASVHVALDHGGAMSWTHAAEHDHGDSDDHDDGDDHHHHDLAAAQLTKTTGKEFFTLVWQVAQELRDLGCNLSLREAVVVRHLADSSDPPPDTRMHGWLFIVRTALPVRGPSLAA